MPIALFTSPIFNDVAAWYRPYVALHMAIIVIALIGLWKMKRWGVLLYAFAVIEGQVALIMIGHWSTFALVFGVAILSAVLYYFPRMD